MATFFLLLTFTKHQSDKMLRDPQKEHYNNICTCVCGQNNSVLLQCCIYMRTRKGHSWLLLGGGCTCRNSRL